MSWGGAEREGDTESEAGSKLWAVSTEPDAGLELTDREIVTWAEVGRSTDWATQAPLFVYLFRERDSKHIGAGKGERENPKKSPHGQHRAQRGARTHRPWDHDLSWSRPLNRLSHPGAPLPQIFNETKMANNRLCRIWKYSHVKWNGEFNSIIPKW